MTDRIRQSTTAFALLLSLILALSSWMATGLVAKGELAVSGPAQLDRGDLHSHGRPAPEAGEVELEDNEDDESRGDPLLWLENEALGFQLALVRVLAPTEVRSLAPARVREGRGARGPPLA